MFMFYADFNLSQAIKQAYHVYTGLSRTYSYNWLKLVIGCRQMPKAQVLESVLGRKIRYWNISTQNFRIDFSAVSSKRHAGAIFCMTQYDHGTSVFTKTTLLICAGNAAGMVDSRWKISNTQCRYVQLHGSIFVSSANRPSRRERCLRCTHLNLEPEPQTETGDETSTADRPPAAGSPH